jgi:putative N6-adenine-specific DNA methylase
VTLRIVATCALGLEDLLAREADGLLGRAAAAAGSTIGATAGAASEPLRGAVATSGSWRDVWRLGLWLRTANRVLVELGSFDAGDEDLLYSGVRKIVAHDRAWDGVTTAGLFDPSASLAVRATCAESRLRDARYVALRAKDAIVDAQRARTGRRSQVSREDPDLPLRLWLEHDRASLLLDTSGVPLDRRGYRPAGVVAPVREQIAAACVLASGWDGRGPVVDPMCGSGTLLVEAGWIALRRAPGGLRRRWQFERFPGFDAGVFARMRDEARAGELPVSGLELHGRDVDPAAIAGARRALQAADLAQAAGSIVVGDGLEMPRPAGPPGLVVVNPPWGGRLGTDHDLWRKLGDLLKQRFAGYRAVVLAGDPAHAKQVGLRPARRVAVRNGPLDARILVYELYRGEEARNGGDGRE